jgi:GH24 family phage-related lysozyme (muramidase)
MSTATGRSIIERFEGKVLHVYLDDYGNPTAGIGHLLVGAERDRLPVGTPISQEQCNAWFDADMAKVDHTIDALGVDLNDNQRAALESLLFNAGVGMLMGLAPKLKAALLARDWTSAAIEFLDICHAVDKTGNRVVDRGLANRRKAESALFLEPVHETEPIDSEQVLALVGLTIDDIRRGMFEA